MKLPAILATVVLGTSSVLFAQTPAPGTAPATGAPGAPAGAKPAAKAPLAGGDKKFVKDQTDGLYLVMDLIGQAKTNANSETVKKLGEKAKADFDKVWADVAGFATDNGETLPKELKGADKSAAERLKKGDKKNWDKEFMKISGKEVKKMAHSFKDSKSLVNPDLKAIAEKWGAVMTGYETEWDTAEKEVSKAKPQN